MSPYRCPHCKSPSIHRARRRGLFEHFVLRFALLRPYRCWSCNHRHYAYLFLRKQRGSSHYASTTGTLLRQLPNPIALVPLLIFVPWALASTGSDLMLLGLRGLGPKQAATNAPEVAAPVQTASAIPALNTMVLAKAPMWQTEQRASAQEKPAGEPEMAPSRPAPAQQGVLGTVTSNGEVLLNGSKIPQLAMIYADDTVTTGPGGNAVLKLQGKGDIEIFPETVISVPNSPQYLAQIDHGRISFRPMQGVEAFQIRVGNFVVIPSPGSVDTVANIVREANGLTHVISVQGSVGIIELNGSQTSFIQNGEELSIALDGTVSKIVPSTPSRVAPMAASSGGGHTPLILLGVGAGGAAAVGVALASGGSEQPSVSPFTP